MYEYMTSKLHGYRGLKYVFYTLLEKKNLFHNNDHRALARNYFKKQYYPFVNKY